MDRIEKIAFLCKGSNCVCDVGCDHAYALIKAITKYGVSRGIASDIALGPLENAKKSIKNANLEDKIEVCLSAGFDNISGEFDTAIIAGMGGALITDILNKGYDKIKGKKLILEANCEVYRIREFLYNNSFVITYEDAFYDQGKYYEIIVCEDGFSKMDNYDILYGPLLRKNPTKAWLDFYNSKIDLIESIIDKINDSLKKENKIKELNELKSLIKYKNMEKYYILDTKNYYRTYFIDDQKRPTIFVAPGGGYKYTSPRESEPVVEAFNNLGYHVVIVNYRETLEEAYPMPGTYLFEAFKAIKSDCRVSKLIGLGFSAGGHCILEMALHNELAKFDLLMLGYPVITADKKYAHLGSFEFLLKEKSEDIKLRKYLSLENEVTKENAVDLFLWGTYTDESVSVKNSLLLIDAYLRVGGNVEYHMFPMGGHGLSVANQASAEGNKEKENPYIARWVEFADSWIKNKLK